MNNPLNFLAYVAILIYIGIGVFFITTKQEIKLAYFGTVSPASKITLGIVLVVYGLYRIYREVKKYRDNHEKE